MKRWPIGLALIGTLLAVGIGVCTERDGAPAAAIESTDTESAAPAALEASEALSAVETTAGVNDTARSPALNSESDAQTSALVLEAVGSDGTPVPHVRFVLARAEHVIENRFVESGGRVSLPALGTDVDVVVITRSTMRLRQHLDDAVGHHVLRIPAGATLRGSVLVDGKPLEEPMLLTIYSRDENVGLEPPPTFVQRQIDFRGYEGRPSVYTQTDATGHFEFRDLPATWVGTIDVADGYLWEEDKPLEITDVTREVLVRLKTPAGISGRIVMPGSKAGAANAQGAWEAKCTDGEASGGIESEGNGRFRVRMPCGDLNEFTATIALAGVGRAAIEVRDVPATGIDVGDVELQRARDVEFIVHDPQGRPIAGAIASTRDQIPITSEPTDSQGKGTLAAIPETTDFMVVRALGYGLATSGLGIAMEPGSPPIDVIMERLPHLEIVVEQRDGKPAEGVFVRITCQGAPPFVIESGGRPSPLLPEYGDGSQPTQVDLGAPQPSRRVKRRAESSADSEYEMCYSVDDHGSLMIPGLSPDARLMARVEDLTGAVLAKSEIAPAFLQSNAPFRIVIDGSPSTLELLVLDAERNPLRGAKVWANNDGPNVATTLADGIAQLTPIYAKSFSLRIEMAGFFPARLEGLSLIRDFERREVVMTLGQTVHVRIVDTSGNAVTGGAVRASLDERAVGKVSRCVLHDECFRVDDLPQQPVQLVAFVGGGQFKKEHDPREPMASIEVPDFGSVLFEFTERLALPARFCVVLTPEPGAVAEDEIVRVVPQDSPVSSFEVPIVLPGRYTAQVKETNAAEGVSPRMSRIEGVVVRPGQRTAVHAVIRR